MVNKLSITVFLLIAILMVSCTDSTDSTQADSQETTMSTNTEVSVNVRFITIPDNANVVIDGENLGQTSLQISLKPGTYILELTLPGFETHTQQLTVEHNEISILVELQPQENLFRIASFYSYQWGADKHSLYLKPNAESAYDMLDMEANQFSPTNQIKPLYWLDDTILLEKLGIDEALPDTIFSTAYISPSGRFIAFVPFNEARKLVIYDTSQEITIPTEVLLPGYSTVENPAFSTVWSANESVLLVKRNTGYANCWYVILQGNSQHTVCANRFTVSGTDEIVFPDNIFATPSDTGMALITGHTDADRNSRVWLVDLETLEGQALPFDNIVGTGFSPGGENIYVAHHQGISSVSVHDLQNSNLITSEVSSQWVRAASFSPYLNYAILYADATEMPSYWIYRIPPVQAQD